MLGRFNLEVLTNDRLHHLVAALESYQEVVYVLVGWGTESIPETESIPAPFPAGGGPEDPSGLFPG
jgi:hypothetical protein